MIKSELCDVAISVITELPVKNGGKLQMITDSQYIYQKRGTIKNPPRGFFSPSAVSTMYGQPPHFSRRGGGRGQPPLQQPPQPLLNPSYLLNNNYYLQTPNFPILHPNFPIENPNFLPQSINFPIESPNLHSQNLNFTPHNQFPNNRVTPHNGTIEKIDKAVVKARRELIAAGENVSALKVSQAALVVLQADSWDSLGINAFIHCFVEVWKITTLFDLETAICKNEGVQGFEELELGPFIRHPLINHYFCVSSDSAGVFKISSKEIISFLVEFMDAHKGEEVKADELLDFIAKKRSVDSKEMLHVRIQSLGSGDDDDDIESDGTEDGTCLSNYSKNSSQSMKSSDRFSSCPYPSASEEMTRLGISSGKEESPSLDRLNCNEGVKKLNKKRKSDAIDCKSIARNKSSKRDDVGQDSVDNKSSNRFSHGHVADMSLSDDSMMTFITLWKEACKRKNTSEVLNQMFQFYKSPCGSKMQRKLVQKIYQSHPLIGLTNVAVKSIKHGMWDSMYDSFQTFEQQEEPFTASEGHIDNGRIETEHADSRLVSNHVSKQHCEVSLEDILKKVSEFFEDNHDVFGDFSSSHLIFLRSVHKCEVWLTEQFVVENFKCFGYGDFVAFLESNVSVLPPSFQKYFVTDGTHDKPSLEACISPQLLDVLVAQASYSLLETENLSTQNVVELLTRQFPLIPFKLVKEGSQKALEDVVKANKGNLVSKGVLFSAALLVPRNVNGSLETCISSKDAIEVLLKAPMLTDLNIWSHWDLKFAPSLGPLTVWLLNEMNAKELLCLVTRSGNVIRIDHTATVDSFLEGFIQGSSFQTAVNLISLFALYGGERNVPSSLLRCHAEKAFKVIVKNSINNGVKDHRNHQNHLMNDLSNEKSRLNDGTSSASKFILDCLTYLPVEFRCFATDLLLSGFRSAAKDAPSAILSQCKLVEHRLMVHELGLSLGIMEWINDYHTFSFTESIKSSEFDQEKDISTSYAPAEKKGMLSTKNDVQKEELKVVNVNGRTVNFSGDRSDLNHKQHSATSNCEKESAMIIESIRREEFGLDSDISAKEDSILKKQHARLGRALHCLSQELYSQDSHFLLELVSASFSLPSMFLFCFEVGKWTGQWGGYESKRVQNADDNVYPCNVEPTLTFILQETGVIVLNNERGFSVENIKALCDVGNSTKKEPSAGYIGKKGIGFKSVFRVTDAPEIHSNGFHIKFDISDGQIGFVLPTVVPPCDIDLFRKLVSVNSDPMDEKCWNTCIVLPFRSKKNEAFSVENLISMFSDLHPSLLLFLHRLECIKFRNLLNDSLIVMRKEVVGDGIVNVSLGKEKMTWFVKSRKLKADHIRQDVQTTEISMALMLEDSNGNYSPKLDHQPVFAFLPLRNYGLKFIIQADFILPSSREEVDGDSPWNQWLLSEFPNLFVGAEMSFCCLPSFKENPGKGVSAFMSFVPLGGEVHGFFSCLPRMIISKLRISNCLLLEGDSNEWVPPCKVLRNWTEQIRSVLPDILMKEHLGVGYLNKDTIISDSLARALGIEECGPRILLQIITSLCRMGSLKSMGLSWLSSWLNVLYLMLVNVSEHSSIDCGTQSDIISALSQLPFIPLMDGKYASIHEGAIWLHTDARVDTEHGLEAFGKLYPKLRIVSPALFNDSSGVENVNQMLYKVGVQRLSAHEVLKVHILPAISNEKVMAESKELMTEYLSFIMFHLESPCPECLVDRENILSQLRNNAFISTNHGYKRLIDVPIHFGKDFGNPIDMNKLVGGTDMKWFEIDSSYLKHPVYASSPGGTLKWRKFLQELGVTDFVQIVQVEKNIADIPHTVLKNMMLDDECISSGSIVKDWDSQELTHLLSNASSNGNREKGKYLLEVLDTLWDEYFGDKLTGFCSVNGQCKPFKASVIRIFHGIQWLASSMDDQLHFSKDLFHKCEAVCAVLGDTAPYVVPKVNNVKLLNDIGLKNIVALDDALSVLEAWREYEKPFRASISQMSKFYTYIWNEMNNSRQKIVENLHSQAFIFVPYSFGSAHEVVSGLFLSPHEVFWHDSTSSMEQMKSIHPQHDRHITHRPFSKMLCNIYPSLHYFFVNEFGVAENPPLLSYLQSLLQLSSGILPSGAAKTVFQIFQKWADGLEYGFLSSDDIDYLKKSMEEKEMTVLPTVQDKWVSLHQSFGLLCWCDDEQLRKEFKNLSNVDFLCFGELSTEEKQMLQDKVSVLFRRLGIPSLSEVVTREAIYYGPTDSSFKTSLVSWALPYAQRYIYNVHPNEYSELKLSGFKNINCLRIVVVEKLFYKNVIKRFGIESNKRCECSCLLQDHILYATRESDTHSLFMELSRFLVAGIPELHLANFLHMITTMAESGSTEDQMEFFIMNSQKLLKLPNEESQWSLVSMPLPEEDKDAPTTSFGLSLDDVNPPPKPTAKKFGNNSSWPPVNWRTAPGFESALKTKAFTPAQIRRDVTEGLIECDGDWIIEENPASAIPAVILEEDEVVKDRTDYGIERDPSGMNVGHPGNQKDIISSDMNAGSSAITRYNGSNASSFNSIERDQLSWGTITPQQVITGRTGELVAFKYFSNKIGEKYVRWVNEVKESGLPYDIVAEGKDKSKEYIEVKATSNARKDWFVISVREWQFAVEKGESFSIARIVLSDGKSAQITTYRNPAKLCQSGHLQLAILSNKS
ncbi:protein of unknown function DUF3883 [Cynara cardunculus var. scolymus]|uniref:Uncharacterized protein n=1 Tax=Cynara cardunculus var. scolymus TaxID=59895 RepID=A0A118JTU8_CYNCS|nr:protein of unknown function DUF3883 [Cynara cardunculus var. scolymus]